jgi:hypothetical protein
MSSRSTASRLVSRGHDFLKALKGLCAAGLAKPMRFDQVPGCGTIDSGELAALANLARMFVAGVYAHRALAQLPVIPTVALSPFNNTSALPNNGIARSLMNVACARFSNTKSISTCANARAVVGGA